MLTEKELRYIETYMDHLIVIAEGTKEEIRSILDSADERGTGFFKDLVKTALPAVGGLLASAIPIPGASIAGGLAGKLAASAI